MSGQKQRADLVRLKDIAKVEIGPESYLTVSDVDGQPNVAIMLNKLSGANALKAMEAVNTELARLSKYYPEDFEVKFSLMRPNLSGYLLKKLSLHVFDIPAGYFCRYIFLSRLAGDIDSIYCYSGFNLGDICSYAGVGI